MSHARILGISESETYSRVLEEEEGLCHNKDEMKVVRVIQFCCSAAFCKLSLIVFNLNAQVDEIANSKNCQQKKKVRYHAGSSTGIEYKGELKNNSKHLERASAILFVVSVP